MEEINSPNLLFAQLGEKSSAHSCVMLCSYLNICLCSFYVCLTFCSVLYKHFCTSCIFTFLCMPTLGLLKESKPRRKESLLFFEINKPFLFMYCLCLIKNDHNTISNLIIHLQILFSNWLTVVHNLLQLFPRVTCTVHRDCVNGKYLCVNRASGFSFVVTALRLVPLLSVSSAQQNLHTCRMSTASKSSFLPVWLRSTWGTKQGVLFPCTSTTSRIVAGTGPYVNSITISQSYLPLTQWGFFATAIPGHRLMTWKSCRYLSSTRALIFA